MIGYRNIYRPVYAMAQGAAAAPAVPVNPVELTQMQRRLAITLGSAETLFGALSTWVGVRAGLNEKGIFSAMGWIVAAGGGVFTMINLLGTIGMIATQPKA
jgi:hypothetical protein